MTTPKADFVLITGASSGIGAVYARKLAARGYNLILVARRLEKLEALACDLKKSYGICVETVQADLSIEEDLVKVEKIISENSNIVMLVNNAGFGTRGTFADVDLEKHLAMINLHVTASARLVHFVLQNMIKNNKGTIVNVASMSGLTKRRGSPTYGGTKAFLNHFSLVLQNELSFRNINIKIQSLCPGYTHTEMHSVGDFKDFNKSKIPSFLWMSAEKVVDISLKKLKKKKVIIVPGFKNKLFLKLINSRIIGGYLVKILSKSR